MTRPTVEDLLGADPTDVLVVNNGDVLILGDLLIDPGATVPVDLDHPGIRAELAAVGSLARVRPRADVDAAMWTGRPAGGLNLHDVDVTYPGVAGRPVEARVEQPVVIATELGHVLTGDTPGSFLVAG